MVACAKCHNEHVAQRECTQQMMLSQKIELSQRSKGRLCRLCMQHGDTWCRALEGYRGVLRVMLSCLSCCARHLQHAGDCPVTGCADSTHQLCARGTASQCGTDFLLPASLQVFQNWWLSVWSNATAAAEAEGSHVATKMYMAVYFTFGMTSLVLQVGMQHAIGSTSSSAYGPACIIPHLVLQEESMWRSKCALLNAQHTCCHHKSGTLSEPRPFQNSEGPP